MRPHLKEASFTERAISKKEQVEGGFPGGPVGKNPPVNVGDMAFTPDLGRSYLPQSN